jgi:rhodanese-related sulfurtransferase
MAVPRISREELKQQLEAADAGARPVLLDVRLKYPYEHSTVRLPGAVRVRPDAPDFSSVPRDRSVVVYDSDPDELVSAPIVAALIRQGYTARALKGGISDWMAANFPTETKPAPKAAPPVAGSLKS